VSLDEVFDLAAYTRHVDTIFARVPERRAPAEASP
jgi:hypothetical protein